MFFIALFYTFAFSELILLQFSKTNQNNLNL